ncbi:MAG: lipopolysaccharide kinase InaA family protein [Pseudomonas sp.]
MSALPFIAVNARALLSRHGLDNFEALWDLELEAVDDPNLGRGGWSSVYRLELEDEQGTQHAFYLKRQDNHLTRTLLQPLGEPTFAREFRFIQAYARQGVPALEAAFYAERRMPGHKQAILMTRALDGYEDANAWMARWQQLPWAQKRDLVLAAGALVRALHNAHMVHNCLYLKHIFLKIDGDGAGARLIDLEKTHPVWFGQAQYVSDLTTLHRRSDSPTRTQRMRFLRAYLGKTRLDQEARELVRAISARQGRKERSK